MNSKFHTMKKASIILVLAILISSCVSKRKYTEIQSTYKSLKSSCDQYAGDIRKLENVLLTCQSDLGHSQNRLRSMKSEVEYFKSTNTNMLDRLADLSVVNKSGAESIKKSLEALKAQNKYIKDLTSSMRKKDSLNLVLVSNLKRSLADVNDEDVTVEVKKGVVYISLSDKMLFRTGSTQIQPQAEAVLGKIAKVVNDHKNLEILVEGHTDNVPIKTDCLADNWDLSVKRATSITRTLQKKYKVAPERMTAGGRGEYVPKSDNVSDAGRSLNRRTEIVVLPRLDEFFQLLDVPSDSKQAESSR